MTRIRWYGPSLVFLVAMLLVMFSGPRVVRDIVHAQERTRIELAAESLEQSELLVQLSRAFRQVADAARPSVVSIHTYASGESRVPRRRPNRRFFHPEVLPDELLEQWRDEGSGEYRKYDRTLQSTGSGWVYDDQGHIVTNNHVIDGSEKIEVHFADGDVRTATVVGTDPDTDVAVLKVDPDHLHPARIAAEPAQQGDMVFAFGSPLRFEFSMSQGVVSATGRQLNIIKGQTRLGLIDGYENFIQTDAAINQGNSGGPLTNIFGQLVGMNTAIATRGTLSSGFVGLGFAIPIDMVREVVEKIVSHGRVERGYLGVTFQPIDAKQAATYGYDRPAVVVTESLAGGPAETAGIQPDDLLTQVNGERIESGEQLRRLIAALAPGSEVKVEVFRQKQVMQLAVVLAAKPVELSLGATSPRGAGPAPAPAGSKLLDKLGITEISTFDQALADELQVQHRPGVLVERVRSGSIADQAGLQPGHLIVRVMDQSIKEAKELVDAVAAQERQEIVRLTVLDGDGRRSIVWLEMPGD